MLYDCSPWLGGVRGRPAAVPGAPQSAVLVGRAGLPGRGHRRCVEVQFLPISGKIKLALKSETYLPLTRF